MNGIEIVAGERLRQTQDYTAEHDDRHANFELVKAAESYVVLVRRGGTQAKNQSAFDLPLFNWPWDPSDWNPSEDLIRNLAKASALLMAQIDVELRKQARESGQVEAVVETGDHSAAVWASADEFYSVYCRAVGGVAFNGDPLPDWKTFAADPAKTKQRDAWLATAAEAFNIANHRTSLVENMAHARVRLEEYLTKCSHCSGTRQDNDGEGLINEPCPKCTDGWAALKDMCDAAKDLA